MGRLAPPARKLERRSARNAPAVGFGLGLCRRAVLLTARNGGGAAMRAITLTLSAAAAIALAGCAAKPEAPPAPPPAPVVYAPPPAPPAPPPPDWRDIALTPGDWSYRAEAAGSVASFGAGTASFVLRCAPAARQLVVE